MTRQILIIMVAGILLFSSCSQAEDPINQELNDMQSTIAVLESQLQQQSENNNSNNNQGSEIVNDQDNSPQMNISPTSESLPTQPVPAGVPVIYGGWALTLSNEIETDSRRKENFKFDLNVRNLSDNTKVFRYVKSGLSARDDIGNTYEFSLEGDYCKMNPDDIYNTQQISIEPGEIQKIYSSVMCDCKSAYCLPPFEGIINLNANELIFSVEDWGPFNDVEFLLEL